MTGPCGGFTIEVPNDPSVPRILRMSSTEPDWWYIAEDALLCPVRGPTETMWAILHPCGARARILVVDLEGVRVPGAVVALRDLRFADADGDGVVDLPCATSDLFAVDVCAVPFGAMAPLDLVHRTGATVHGLVPGSS